MIEKLAAWCRAVSAGIGFAHVRWRVPDGRRQLLVDVSTIARSDAGTGIQRVVRALWLELKSMEGETFIVTPIVGARRCGYRVAPDDFLQRRLGADLDALTPARIAKGDIFLGLDLAAHIIPHRAGDLRRWQAHGVVLAFVVYDLLPALHPQWFSQKSGRNYRRWLSIVLSQADQVICIAEAVKRDLQLWIETNHGAGSPQPRLAVMRLSGDITASYPSRGLPVTAEDVFAWTAASSTILMVGTIEPRKGYDQALAAFERLWGSGDAAAPQLLIVGRPGWMTEALQQQMRLHPEHGQRLMWIDDAGDEYLEGLYARCDGLLFASRAEGFGLPLLEAASHGKPALARDLPVFREVAPPSVTFFATDDADELATAITRWMADKDTRAMALVASPQVSWSNAVADLIAALGLHGSPRPAP